MGLGENGRLVGSGGRVMRETAVSLKPQINTNKHGFLTIFIGVHR